MLLLFGGVTQGHCGVWVGSSRDLVGILRAFWDHLDGILQTARVDYQKALLGHYGPPVRH